LRRPPPSLIVLTLCGGLLAAWLAFHGLYVRMFGEYIHLQGLLGLWMQAPDALGRNPFPIALHVEPERLAWPLLAVGMSWSGALSAIWLRRRWGYRSLIGLGLISLLAPGLGTVLALVVLFCLWLPSTKRWIDVVGEPHAV
jgi:hypothetical protein